MLFFILRVALALSCNNEVQAPPVRMNVATNLPQVDTVVRNFMNKYKVPGLSLAITKNGKLVYVQSYGKADEASGASVTAASLFRIASVSKPITAIAILKLVEEGKLRLDQKVFGPGSLLGTQYGTEPYGAHITDITVRHLLQHTAGGWSNDRSDPMFSNPSMSQAELISWTLNNRPLNHPPGAAYAYSNFGYCVLGRVIEKLSGQSYEEHVKQAVLQPAGIRSMTVSGNTEAERKQNEVTYYGQGNQNPYVYSITRMDSHGGWLANATDLARLLVRVDGFASKPDMLSPASIAAMTTPSAANANYALGWSVNKQNNWWHMGSPPGTTSEMARTSGGYGWVVLCNTRGTAPGFNAEFDELIWPAINNPSTPWPDVDLF